MKWKRSAFSVGVFVLTIVMLSSNVAYAAEIGDMVTDEIVVEEIIVSDGEATVEENEDENMTEIIEQTDDDINETEDVEFTTESEITEDDNEIIESQIEIVQEGETESCENINDEEIETAEDGLVIENPYVWSSDNFEISRYITNDWGTGYQCEITITNIGDSKIEDWKLMMEISDVIDNIWNASVISADNGLYEIENVGWNGDISEGSSVSFGFVASYDEAPSVPMFYGVTGTERELGDESYQVTYQVSDLWENGYVGYVTISNMTDTDLKNWKLTFDLSDTIVNLWNGVIASNDNGQYVVEYASYNSVIPAGGSVTVGFTAEAEETQVYPENYSVKVVVHNEMDTTSRDDVIGIAYFEPITEADVRIAEDGIQYVVNQLNLVGEEGTTYVQIAALGEEYGFEIVGYIEFTNDYQIKFVNDKTSEELLEFCNLFEAIDYVCEANLNVAVGEVLCNEPNNESNADGYIPNDKKWVYYWDGDSSLGNWGLKAINAPIAWQYQDRMSSVKVGVFDNYFTRHGDIDYKVVWEGKYFTSDGIYDNDEGHGTAVAGVMAASFDNDKGIAGVVCKPELYAYSYQYDRSETAEKISYSHTFEKKYALALMIGNGVRVLNFSNGLMSNVIFAASEGIENEGKVDAARNYIKAYTYIIDTFLLRLIDRGYDFVIIQAAGNENDNFFVEDDSIYGCKEIELEEGEKVVGHALIGGASAKYSSNFSYSTILQSRVIVVGAYKKEISGEFQISTFSNVGDRVDVVAPGENIGSTVPLDMYRSDLSGTSFSAPYVSGTAALIYSVNPELSGPQVKEIIVETATKKLSGLDTYVVEQDGYTFTMEEDNREYKCLDTGAAVERALEEKGDTPILGENTGFIMGKVSYQRDPDDEDAANKDTYVSAYRYSSYDGNVDTDYQYSATCDSENGFSLCMDPGTYQVTIYREGYIPLVLDDIEVREGEVEYLEKTLIIKEDRAGKRYDITGRVVDALSGSPIEGADIKFRSGWNQKYSDTVFGKSAETDINGNYTVKLKGGYYTAEISKDGYITGYVNIVVYDNLVVQEAVLSPLLKENEVRIVLTWGDSPRDLDSHMYITTSGTELHTWYGQKTTYDENGEVICQLDHDDTTSYGPETITLYLDDEVSNYKYSVYQFSVEGDMSLSGARVVVYYANKTPITYHIPMQQEGRTWDVFSIVDGEIVPINTRY